MLAMTVVPSWLIAFGQWLVVKDPLETARAIVVLNGYYPIRATEAARLYHQGLAPEVWVTRSAPTAEDLARERLGIPIGEEHNDSLRALQHLGVPADSIRLLDDAAANTEAELRVIAKELQRVGGEKVILVTTKAHTRRVKAIWRAVVGETPGALVRYAPTDPYDPNRWWRSLQDVAAVGHETLGLLNVWAGFPYSPARRRGQTSPATSESRLQN